ncbi:RNA polymerase sigma factor [Rubripirellula reticaptiva]|uniref:ECF RNA polymerase sigma factor SigW n=1 Tax=Rubripirellula reticaptiva TaxID=2528013 RepID=A0A5C6FAY6_9BACT|nr:RNA polymerase sigma factor [Rubripirellula reticaptiva]TWU57484.1 ECF RNA polymerase sigma factor SigW [Rubripirellula reticaptiva]
MDESNALLADQFGDSDENAFAKLMRRHHALVFQICLRMLGHRQDAEDATQETFSRLARYLDRWDRRRPLEPWLVTIAGNRCRTLMARKPYHTSLASSEEPATIVSTLQREADSLAEEVQLAIGQLADDPQRAFRMFHEHSMDYAQIADRMNRPIGTIKTWVHRSRLQLIESLREREVIDVRSRQTTDHPNGRPTESEVTT